LPRPHRSCKAGLPIVTVSQASLSMDRDLLHEIALPWRIFKSSLRLTRLSATVICFTREASHSIPRAWWSCDSWRLMMQEPLASCNPPNSCHLTEAPFKGRDPPQSLCSCFIPLISSSLYPVLKHSRYNLTLCKPVTCVACGSGSIVS
jgi:hypothetical protein